MKRNKINILAGLLGIITFAFFSCKDNAQRNARLEVRLTDAPADYQEVNIDIQEVKVHAEGGDSASGWKSLSINKGIYDLRKLTDGLDTLLGAINLPAGKISQIRLVLGSNNSVKLNGQTMPLNTPSAQQSGLKSLVNTTLAAGITYKILLDFDAARSIVSTGSGNFNLKPVIRSVVEAQTGAIKGVVTPIEATPAIYAIINSDTVSTFADPISGKFLIKGLTAGSYKVVLVPKAGFITVEKQDVSVTLGIITDLGTVTIPQ